MHSISMLNQMFNSFNVVATANDGTTSGPIVIDGFGGAHYIGFYTTGAACVLTTIQITMPVAADGFAVGNLASISVYLTSELWYVMTISK